jgi:periplasmic divalent cation tolerance protein
MSALIVFCTCPDTTGAEALARALVDGRLAACVNVLPGVRSVYRWRDAVESSEEVQLLIKTTRDRFDALREAIRVQHPYELPELIAVEAVAGLDPYLAWIEDSTRAAPHADRG